MPATLLTDSRKVRCPDVRIALGMLVDLRNTGPDFSYFLLQILFRSLARI